MIGATTHDLMSRWGGRVPRLALTAQARLEAMLGMTENRENLDGVLDKIVRSHIIYE